MPTLTNYMVRTKLSAVGGACCAGAQFPMDYVIFYHTRVVVRLDKPLVLAAQTALWLRNFVQKDYLISYYYNVLYKKKTRYVLEGAWSMDKR